MKGILHFLTYFLIFAFIVYLANVIVNLQLDITQWTREERQFSTFLTLTIGPVFAFLFYVNK